MNLYDSIAVYPVQDGQFYAKKAPTSSSPGPSPWRILKMSAWHITHSVVICIDHVCGCCVSRQFLHVCIGETFRKELPTWNARLQRHLEQKRPVCRHGDRRDPSQPHLCFCLHARIWQLYFIRSLSKRRKITAKLLKIIKHTFRNITYSKTIRIRFTMLYQ